MPFHTSNSMKVISSKLRNIIHYVHYYVDLEQKKKWQKKPYKSIQPKVLNFPPLPKTKQYLQYVSIADFQCLLFVRNKMIIDC